MDASTAENEPESSTVCRNDIIAMLSASGYHRARVAKLNDYDRIIGGIAWAITRCDDVEVAANLLYEESEDQNIKLRTEQSEQVLKALTAVGCPHQISAHQIFGLDFLALKNVVQWLLRRMLSPQNQNRFKVFTDWFVKNHVDKEKAIKEFRQRLRQTTNTQKTTRHWKRFDNSIMYELGMDAKCTLAEYVTYSRNGIQWDKKEEKEGGAAKQENAENLQEASTKKHVPTSTVRDMMDQATVDEIFKNDTPDVIESRDKICQMIDQFNVPQRLAMLEYRLVKEASQFLNARRTQEELQERYNKFIEHVEKEESIDRQQMRAIHESFKLTEMRAKDLREHVITDLKNAQAKEDQMRRNVDKFGNIQKYSAHRREVMEQYAEKTKQVGKSVKETITLQFRLDRIMSHTLNAHYRKRNMERIQDSSELTQEAKTAVVDYNVTIDILTFSAKINGFINEVEKTLLAQPATQEYRDAFVSYMNDVRNQLGEYHWKAKATQDKSKTEKEHLQKLRADIREKEREVLFATGELTKILELNRVLQKTAADLDVLEENSPAFDMNARLDLATEYVMQQLTEGL